MKAVTKTTRTMTICSADNNASIVILKGKWLRTCGFLPGDQITIEIKEPGKLVITNVGSKFKK